MKALWIAGLFLGCAALSRAQASSVPDLSDFSKSSTENIINPIKVPFQVQSVSGTISAERSGEALAKVLFEIEGPGAQRKMRHAVTDSKGRFTISRVPKGIYRFKATLDGFQSVVGTIVVGKMKSGSGEIEIHMSIGA